MSSTSSDQRSSRPNIGFDAIKNHFMAHKIDCTLWTIRVIALLFTVGYFIPLFGNAQNAYYKVLIANAAISALRLHQRLGTVQFTREFLAKVLIEDSCHYLFYSIIFLYAAPVSLVLMPIALFCVLHVSSYSLTLLDILGQNSWWGARLLISLVEFQSVNILRLIAIFEIILMPYTIILVLFGRASLLTPFIYYQFLTQRYVSTRNPYTRNMFYELRLLASRTADNPKMPLFMKNIIYGSINFISKLAPPRMVPTQQSNQ